MNKYISLTNHPNPGLVKIEAFRNELFEFYKQQHETSYDNILDYLFKGSHKIYNPIIESIEIILFTIVVYADCVTPF